MNRAQILLVPIFVLAAARTSSAQINALRLGTDAISPGVATTASLIVDGVTSVAIGGVQFGVTLPAGVAFVDFVENDAEFVGIQSGADFVTVGILFSISGVELRPPGFFTFGTLNLDVPALAAGETLEIDLASGLGSPPIIIEYATEFGPVVPFTLSGGVVAATTPESQLWAVEPGGADALYRVDVPGGLVEPAIPDAGFTSPTGVAVDPNGVAWVTYAGADVVRRFDSDGAEIFVFGTSSRIQTGLGPEGIAIDTFGNAWVANRGDNSVSQVDAFGRVIFGGDGPPIDSPDDGFLGAAIPFARPPRSISADRAGSVWVVSAEAGMPAPSRVARINRSGAVAFSIDLGLAGAVDVAVDQRNFGWITLRDLGRVERRASDGQVFETWNVASPSSVAVRRDPGLTGGREGWVVSEATGQVHRLRLDGSIATFDFATATSVVIDGGGRPWIADSTGTITQVDPASTPPTLTALTALPLGTATAASFLGDTSGYTQGAVQFPEGSPAVLSFFDFDGDGFVNLVEIEEGSDFFDAASVPAIPVAPVQGLECSNIEAVASLTWTNASAYDAIEVSVDGVLDQTLAGTVTGASVTLPGPGQYTLEVVATIGASASTVSNCLVVVGAGEVEEAATVVFGGSQINPFDIAVTDQTGPCVPTFLVTDAEARQVYILDETLVAIGSFSSDVFDGDFGARGIAFNPLGDAGNGSIYLTGGSDIAPIEIVEVDMDGQIIEPVGGGVDLTLTDGGVPVLGEPGAMAASTIDPGAGGGGGGIFLLIGPDGCLILGVAADSSGELIPDITFSHPTGALGDGLNGIVIGDDFDESGGLVGLTAPAGLEDEYELQFSTVSAGVATPTGDEIFLGLLDLENVLGGVGFSPNPDTGASELGVVGITTSSVYRIQTTQLYIRGDANGDEALDIADAIAVLQVLFQGAMPATCEVALDANADGNTDIADAIFILSFLFSGGPAPAEPFPDPGATGVPLECL